MTTTYEVRPVYADTMTVAGMVRDLHDAHHNAAGPACGYLVKAGLMRVNRRTGWYDTTPAGRALIMAGLRDGTIPSCEWGTCSPTWI